MVRDEGGARSPGVPWARERARGGRVARRHAAALLVALLVTAPAPPAGAGLPETPHPRQLSVADGLPSNRINAVTEDRQGYLWIATSDGLARYDGIGYRTWRSEQGLGDNFVWSLHVDAHDRLWVGTGSAGLAVLDPARRSFRHYTRANTPGMGSDTVWSVASTADGAVWFGTSNGGLHRMSPSGEVTRFVPRAGDVRSLPDLAVTHLAVAPDGVLWIATRAGAAYWTGRDFVRVDPAALHSPIVDGLAVEDDGTVWFGTPRGATARTPSGRMVPRPWADHGADTVFKVLRRDASGAYWLDIAEGLGRVSAGQIANVPLYSAAARGIVKPSWSGGFEDRHGGLWLASAAHGLWYLPATWRRFSVLSRRAGEPDSPANAHVKGIAAAASGSMWLVGSGGMLDELDPERGLVTHRAADIGAGSVPVAVLEDSLGKVWVGHQDGVARYDPADGSVRRWGSADATDAALRFETAHFAETGDGSLWMASDVGSVQLRRLDGSVQATLVPGDGHGLAPGTVIAQLGLAPDGALWLAGSEGLLVWNAGAGRFERVPGTSGERVHAFARDGNGHVWLARAGRLERYAWTGTALVRGLVVDGRDGLPAIAPTGLLVDASGVAWLTSVRGLVRVDSAARSVRVYGVQDGLPSQEFSHPPVARRGDGRILVGSPDGLVLFDPAMVAPAEAVPELAIESVTARRGDGRVEFPHHAAFEVAHHDRDLRVVARLLSFTGAGAHRYRFRLRGHDPQWVEVGATGERLFPQLEAGSYHLDVKARTADASWSEARSLAFRVAAPWWRTPAALVAWAVLAVTIAWWLASLLRQRLRHRNAWVLARHTHALAEQASLAKTHFLATLGHEVRTPMTGVLGMAELLLDTELDARQRGYTESIRRAGGHLMRLVNDALDLARIEAGRLELDVQPFELQALLDDVVALMAPVARQRGLEFRIHCTAVAPWLQGDAMRVRQILLNLVGNAIKFTERGHVALDVRPVPDAGVGFSVSDTGPGLDDAQRERLFRRFEQADGARTATRYGGSGLGLAICQELAAAMGGQITVDSVPGHGATFRVLLPLEPAVAIPAARPSNRRAATRALSVLLVEDDPTVAEVIVGLLRAQGHAVAHAAHGLAALAELAMQGFDMILLDLDLPGMDGIALARQLRLQGFDRPLVAVTARADAAAEGQARDAGCDGFLRKPLTGEMLAEALDAAALANASTRAPREG